MSKVLRFGILLVVVVGPLGCSGDSGGTLSPTAPREPNSDAFMDGRHRIYSDPVGGGSVRWALEEIYPAANSALIDTFRDLSPESRRLHAWVGCRQDAGFVGRVVIAFRAPDHHDPATCPAGWYCGAGLDLTDEARGASFEVLPESCGPDRHFELISAFRDGFPVPQSVVVARWYAEGGQPAPGRSRQPDFVNEEFTAWGWDQAGGI